MKTTLEIPDELYRRVKAQAALEGIKVKELVSEGLGLALEWHTKRKSADPLEVMERIRRHPLHSPSEVERMMELARNARSGGWNREDAGQ